MVLQAYCITATENAHVVAYWELEKPRQLHAACFLQD